MMKRLFLYTIVALIMFSQQVKAQSNFNLNSVTPLTFSSFGNGDFNKSVIYHNNSLLLFELAKKNDSNSAMPIDFRIGTRGGTHQFFTIKGENRFVGIGTINPQANLHIHHGNEMSAYLRLESKHVGQNASVQFCSANTYRWELGTGISAQSAFELFDRTDGVSRLVVLDGGNVGIGTIKPAYKLDVLGTIRTRELKVDMQGADFVFEENYPLRPISELEDFVKANKHLPEIAPAKEMQANGVNQSEMNQKLLQKIEELTLYVIDLNKKVGELQEENKELKNKINE